MAGYRRNKDRTYVDGVSGAAIGIDCAHHEVHEGDGFHCHAINSSLADNGTVSLAFKTPDGTKRVHMVVDASVKVAGDWALYEAPTWTQGTGSAATIYNRKRESSPGNSAIKENRAQPTFTASNEMIRDAALNVAAGTLIEQKVFYGSRTQPPAGSRATTEWVLQPSTQYALVFTADGATNGAQIAIDWYEHTDSH